MKFQHYHNFVTIIDSGTILAASKALFVAQPALSNQLKTLEQEYGAQLVVRGPRSLALTDAGRIFYDKAKTICYLEDAIKKEINACTAGNRGTLWLGLTPAYPDPAIGDILLRFHERYPEISFEIIEANSGQIVELLENGVVEIGVIRTPIHVPLTLRPVFSIKERLMAVYDEDNPWLRAGKGELSVSALKDVPLSISQRFRKIIEEACLKAGFRANFLSVSTSRRTALMWAQRNAAVAIIVGREEAPHLSEEVAGFICRPLKGKDMRTKRSFAVQQNRRLSAPAETFLDYCEKYLESHTWPVPWARN